MGPRTATGTPFIRRCRLPAIVTVQSRNNTAAPSVHPRHSLNTPSCIRGIPDRISSPPQPPPSLLVHQASTDKRQRRDHRGPSKRRGRNTGGHPGFLAGALLVDFSFPRHMPQRLDEKRGALGEGEGRFASANRGRVEGMPCNCQPPLPATARRELRGRPQAKPGEGRPCQPSHQEPSCIAESCCSLRLPVGAVDTE